MTGSSSSSEAGRWQGARGWAAWGWAAWGILGAVLALLLSVLSASALSSVTTNSAGALVFTNHCGDLNDDGKVDVRDLVLLTHHLNGTRPLTGPATNWADVNVDGTINATDRSILVRMIAARYIQAGDDFDEDELSNAEEIRRGTNPFDPDTDHDGWLDGWEVVDGTNPLDAQLHAKIFAVSRPPVQVIYPLLQDTDTNTLGVVLARPPVQVYSPELPEIEEAGTIPVARPPVQLFFPALPEIEEAGAIPVARPPVQLFFPALPEVEEAGAIPVARPPITVTNPPPQ